MKSRTLKVAPHHPDRSGTPPRDHRALLPPMPSLRLRGRWMAQAGFPIGARVHVEVQHGRLIVTPEEDS
ncbi:MAG: SymE family type I addiction module toxin [Sulfuricaulis sp.]